MTGVARLSSVASIAVAVLATIWFPSIAAAEHGSCDDTGKTKVNRIHVGDISGSASVKVVGQIECTQEVDLVIADIFLFFCGEKEPRNDEDWLNNNCDVYGNSRTWTPFPNDDVQTVRAPRNADAPVLRTGWYHADMIFTADDTHSGETKTKTYGWYWAPEPRYCHGTPGGGFSCD